MRATSFVVVGALLVLGFVAGGDAAKPCKPNIIFILVDDQDPNLNTTHPEYMPNLNKWMIKDGVKLENYRINTPICCPSRATILSGRHTHNTNFTNLWPPYGGYTGWKLSKQESMGYLPSWMQDMGYYTSYIGKLVVEYSIYNYNLKPQALDHSDLLTFPWVFDYDHPVMSYNSKLPVKYKNLYSTDVIAFKAVNQIKKNAKRARNQGKPFFMTVAPTACHDWMNWKDNDFGGTGKLLGPPKSPKRYRNFYKDVKLPRNPNFMEGEESFRFKPKWLRDLYPEDKIPKDTSFMDEYYRLRLRALRAADDMVGKIFDELELQGILDDTYVVYTSDNGYHIGAHRMHAGKETSYEEDTHVPFFVRGPGLKSGIVDNVTAGSHVDLASTFYTLAGGDFTKIKTDGQPLPLHKWAAPGKTGYFDAFKAHYTPYEITPIEYWGDFSDQQTDVLQIPLEEQKDDPLTMLKYPSVRDLLYKAVRADFGENLAFKYVISCGKVIDRELYDITHDQFELANLVNVTSRHHPPEFIRKVLNRMDVLISLWYPCIGTTNCVNPLANLNASMAGWPVVAGVPAPPIKTLQQSLDPLYDSFFTQYGENNRFRWKQQGGDDIGFMEGTGCLNHWDWDNEQGTLDAYPWIKAKENPHWVVDWGVSATTDDFIALAQSKMPELQQAAEAAEAELQAAAAAAPTAGTDEGVQAKAAAGPQAWPGIPGKACSAEKPGGRHLLTVGDTTAEHASIERFARKLTQEEVDETMDWMQKRMQDKPFELVFFR